MRKFVLAALWAAGASVDAQTPEAEPAVADAPAPATPVAPACVFRDDALPDAPVAESSVVLLGTSPAENADVRRATVLAVDAEYRIAKFEPGTYVPIGLFAESSGSSMSPNDSTDTPALAHAHGNLHLCVSLAKVYASDFTVVPFEFRVVILRMQGAGGRSVAQAKLVKFKPVDLSPDELAARKTVALPEGYVDALRTAFDHFDTRAARYHECVRRFPAAQPLLTKTYRAWERRHWSDIQFISARMYGYDLAITHDQPANAVRILDSTHDVQAERFAAMGNAELQKDCDFMREDMLVSEDVTNDAISDEIAEVRKWTPPHRRPKMELK